MRTHVFLDRLVSEGALRSSIICCHHGTCLVQSMVKLDAKNDMQAEFSGLAMVVRILVAMRNLLGDL
jgi:hypothetical protein